MGCLADQIPIHPADPSIVPTSPVASGLTRDNSECFSKATEITPADSALVLACGTQESWTYRAPDSVNPTGVCEKTTSTIHSDGQTVISTAVTQEINNDPCCIYGI